MTFDAMEITGPACASCFAKIGRTLGFRVLGLLGLELMKSVNSANWSGVCY